MKKNPKTKEQLLAENEDLRRRLEEAEEILRAIREGEVDALVLSKPQGEAVFTLKGAEHPYRVFVESMNEGAATLDQEGTILYCNNCFAEMVKLSTDKVIGSSIHRFIPTKDRFGFELAFQGGLQGNSTADISLKREDQELIPVHLSFNPLHMQDLPVVCLVAMDLTESKRLEEALRQLNADLENRIQDRTAELRKGNKTLQAEIVERKRTEEALRQSREDLNRAQEVGQVGSWRLNIRRNVLAWSDEAYRIFGLPKGTPLTYETFLEVVHPDDREYVDTQWMAALKGELYDIEHRVVVAGQIKWVREKAYLEFNDDGELLSGFGISQDINERKLAEAEQERLRNEAENERRRLVAVFAALPVGVAITDVQGGTIQSNDAFKQIWGNQIPQTRSIDDYSTYKAWWADTGKPVAPEEWASAQVVRKGKPVKQQVMKIQRFDGSHAFVINSGAPFFDERNRIAGCAVTIQDISDLRKAEEALRESEIKYRTLFETMTEGFSIADIILDKSGRPYDLRCIEANPAVERQTGLKVADIIGRTTRELFPQAEPIWFERFGKVLLTGEPAHFEASFGSLNRWFEVSAYRTGTNRFAVIFFDITERKRMEEELRELAQRLSYHVDHAPLAVIEWGPDMQLIRWSDEAERVFGWRADEVLGKRVEDLCWVYDEDQTQVAEVTSDLTSGTNPHHFSCNRNYRKDGTVIHCEWYNSSLLDESGQLRSILSRVLDVTARKQAEEKIKTLLREKEVLLREVHHRLKNNMLVMITMLTLQSKTLKSQEAVAALADIKGRLQSQYVLYDQLYRKDNLKEMSTTNYIPALVNKIIDAFPDQASIKIETRIDEFLLGVETIFPLGILINELLTNSMKYAFIGRDDGLIIVSATIKDHRVTLVIEDSGIGLPESIDLKTSCGFGLKLVGMLTSQIYGTIRIEREKGTRFILEFEI